MPKDIKKDKKNKKERQDRSGQEDNEAEAMNIDMETLRLNNPFIKK